MTIVLELAPDEEAQLRENADRCGLSAEEYVLAALRREFERDRSTPAQADTGEPTKSLAEMLAGRIGLFNSADKREPPPPHTDPHEIAFGEIMREKYRKQGFNL